MRVIVLGGNGQLGTDLVEVLTDFDVAPLCHRELDICDFPRTRGVLSEKKPEIVINAVAFNRVDDCEEEIEKAFWVNAYAVRNLAQICADLQCTLVHISTDYVFGGDKTTPYIEEDNPKPLNVNGVSKLAGEYFVNTICTKRFVVRTSGLYGAAGSSRKGGNFVKTMIRLAQEGKRIRVVNDQALAPTYTRDLANQIRELLLARAYGLYHVTNSGQCSWFEFASKLFEIMSIMPDFGPVSTAEYGAAARRPAWSVLAQDKIRGIGLKSLRPWPEALRAYLRQEGYLA